MNDITENAAIAAKAIQNKNNMNVTENQANAFQTEATAQLDDHKSVVNGQNSSENISTEQEEGAQATTGASPVDLNENDPEDAEFTEITPEDELKGVPKKTAETRMEIEKRLNAGEEVQLYEFLKVGFTFADMPAYLQRKETKKNVSDLKKSLIECKTFYRPIEIVSAKDFIEAGLGSPLHLDGTPINLDDPDIDLIWLRPDGKQRSCAAANLFSSKEYLGKESEFDVRVKLCPSKISELPTYIREIQVAAVWDEKTNRETTTALFDGEDSALPLMNKYIESGMTARAAYKVIYFKDSYKKSLYEESVRNGKLHKDLKITPELTKRAEHVFESFKIAFRAAPKFLKNSAAIDALIDVYSSATVNQNEAVELFLSFLMRLEDHEFKDLEKAGSVAEKKNTFLEIFDEFKKELEDRPSDFKSEVNKAVENAKSEYSILVSKPKAKKTKVRKEVTYYKVRI